VQCHLPRGRVFDLRTGISAYRNRFFQNNLPANTTAISIRRITHLNYSFTLNRSDLWEKCSGMMQIVDRLMLIADVVTR
jgi:hypothetical protein